MNEEITLDYLDKVDGCYIEAIEDALAYRGNFKYNTTERLTELLYMFKYRQKTRTKKEGNQMKELLLGCGSRTEKDLHIDNPEFENVTRLDYNADHKPDIVWDLTVHPLPFNDEEFDEIHAYEVLEHLAPQGDYEFFFKEFTEYWRILKPHGRFFASVPVGVWTWGDPSHKRSIQPETLIFLDQDQYAQVGTTSMSDFRNIYKVSFKVIYQHVADKFYFVLEKE